MFWASGHRCDYLYLMARYSIEADYRQARSNHEYLWRTYAPARDMTGAYVDQQDLHKLLQNPNEL